MVGVKADHNLLALIEYSSAHGMQVAFLFAVVLVFIGFLLSLFIKPPPLC
jgi:tetrahydromethanopterin S-methyltransferase subunit F